MSSGIDPRQVTRSDARSAESISRIHEPGQARQRLLDSTQSISNPPAYRGQVSREQRVAALNVALDIGKTLNHLLNGTKRELSKMPPVKVSAPPKDASPAKPSKPSRPPQAAQLRKVVTASRAAASQAITRTKQRRNATSVVGKPRFGRRPPPKRAKRDPDDPLN